MTKINKSWAATITPLVMGIMAIIADMHPELAPLVSQEAITSFLALFGVAGGLGTINSIKKKKDEQKTKEIETQKEIEQKHIDKEREIETIKEQKRIEKEKELKEKENKRIALELQKKKIETEAEVKIKEIESKTKIEEAKVKLEIEKEKTKVIKQIPNNNKPREIKKITPEEFATKTPQEQDDFINTGGIVTKYIRDTGPIQWWNMSDMYDTTLDNDPNFGPVHKYGEEYLWVRFIDAEYGHTLVLESIETGNKLQVDQKPKNIPSKIKMRDFKGKPYAKGQYKIILTGMGRGTSYTTGTEINFTIV